MFDQINLYNQQNSGTSLGEPDSSNSCLTDLAMWSLILNLCYIIQERNVMTTLVLMLCSHRLPNGSVSEMAELQPTQRMWLMPVRILWFAASGSVCEVPQQTQGTQKALLPALTPCSHTAWNFTSKQRGHLLKICHSPSFKHSLGPPCLWPYLKV